MRRHEISLALVCGAALALTGCGTDGGETLRIGGLFSTTGSLAETGFAQLSAARLAITQINEQGGVRGKKLELVYRDDGGDPGKAERAAEGLRREDVSVIVGTTSSALTLQVSRQLGDRAVLVSPSATAAGLTSYDDGGRLLRTCASDAGEGRLLASRTRPAAQRVAIIRRTGEIEGGLAEAFRGWFERAGGTIVAAKEYVPGQENYAALLDEVLAAEPQAILLDADPVSGAQIITDFVYLYPGQSLLWVFSHSLQSEAFVNSVGARGFSFPHLGSGPSEPSGRGHAFFAEGYRGLTGNDPKASTFAANTYDAVYLSALALEKAQTEDPDSVAIALRPLSFGGRAYGPHEYAATVAALRANQDVNYEGASGSVDFDANGDVGALYDLWEVLDGQIALTTRRVLPPF